MICVFLAEGFEEIEALAPVDILRRARIDVKTVSILGKTVSGTNGIKIEADVVLDQLDKSSIDGVVLPGGMPGAENLFKSEKIKEVVKYCFDEDKLVAAICAAPMILGRMNFLNGRKACCYPGFENELKGAEVLDQRVLLDGNIITGKGPGAAIEFSLKIVEVMSGYKKSQQVRLGLQ